MTPLSLRRHISITVLVTMRLSSTVMEIWRLKDNGVTSLTFFWGGSRDVIGHVTIQLPGVDFLSVFHSDYASIWHRYGDMAVLSSSRKALPGTEVGRRSVGPQYYTDLIYSSSLR